MRVLGAPRLPGADRAATDRAATDRAATDRAATGRPRNAPPAPPPPAPDAESGGRYTFPGRHGLAPGPVALAETKSQLPARPADSAGPAAASGAPISIGGPVAEAASATFAAKIGSLDALATSVAACRLCGLHATAQRAVPGEGSPDAKFVCVGEAPGASEDETGRPFVGKAGQLLTKILEAIQFKREDVFICNVLKHRPPGNRNPAPDEITACSPYLLQQLALLRPRVILALGTFAAQTLLQTTLPISKLRGQIHRFHGVPLIVTYHPAALLRNPNWKRPTWEDVQLARRVFDNAPDVT